MRKPDQGSRRPHRGIPGHGVRWQPHPADHALGSRGHHTAGPDLAGTTVSHTGPQYHPGNDRTSRNPAPSARTHGIVHCCHKP